MRDEKELQRIRRDVPLLHVVYAVEEKAKEMESLGALPEGVPPVRVLSAFGLWCAVFVLNELAACGNADAKKWAADLAKSRDNYRKKR
jgi:hypothetical protein